MDPYGYEVEREREHEPVKPPQPEPPQPEHAMARLASDIGNQAFSNTIAREGSGVMDNGQVHPSVEQSINQTRGSGSSLDSGVAEKFSDSLGDLSDVKVHTDDKADHLARTVSARAFATGSDVYFAKGEYNPGSSSGDKLIAHELAHVVQQRGAPTSGPMTVTNPGDSMEREADSVADSIAH